MSKTRPFNKSMFIELTPEQHQHLRRRCYMEEIPMIQILRNLIDTDIKTYKVVLKSISKESQNVQF